MILFALDHRERWLLAPAVERIAAAERELEAARVALGQMLQLRAGRDDISLNPQTWEVSVPDPLEDPG
jgi:hypothetical protein